MTLRKLSAASLAAAAIFSLAACGSDDSEPKKDSTSEKSETPTKDETETPEAPSEGSLPSWAKPFEQSGEKIGTAKVGDVTVDVYQLGTVKASRDSMAVDSKTRKPLINEGDDIVFVNYVVTNTGDPIDLSNLLVDVDVRYEDWKYLGGMPGIVDSAQYEKFKVDSSATKPGYTEDVFTLGKGESYAYGENFLYQKGKKITIEAEYIPVDEAGERLSDEAVEGEGTGAIK